MKTNHKRHL